jgi:uncharacterized protein YjbJ (UPF0337 family)
MIDGPSDFSTPAVRPSNNPTHHMNTDTMKGNWNVTKGKLKQKFAQLTDNDLAYVKGKEDELLGRIQKKTGQTREALEQFLRDDCGCDFSPPSRTDLGGDEPAPDEAEQARRAETHQSTR